MSRALNPGRLAAARALVAIDDGAHAEEALAHFAPKAGADRSLAWFLVTGVLQRRSHLDASLRVNLRQPLTGLEPEVRAALRIGAFEVLFARTAPHAAVHQGVEIVIALQRGRAKGLVNAVLRRVKPPENLSRAESLDHPSWIVDRWDERYGAEATTAWCERNNTPAPLMAVSTDAPALLARWREAGIEATPARPWGEELAGVLVLPPRPGAVTDLPGFDEGLFWIQDAASVRVADLVGAGQGTRVLDACAAPGGKSFRLASQGAEVTAVDSEDRRLQRMDRSLVRLKKSIPLVRHDWTTGPLPGARTWDAVLVDAPCTALGLLRRHPEIRWRRQWLDLAPASERQQAVLAAAAQHVRPGGVLVYAVCSPEPEEGPQVVDAFVAANANYRLETSFTTAPPTSDEDAFYAARIVRR